MLFSDSDNGLPAEEITLAEQLKKTGYATQPVAEWHLGTKQYLPTNNGFDYYYGIPYSNDMDNVADMKAIGGYEILVFRQHRAVSIHSVPINARNTEVIGASC